MVTFSPALRMLSKAKSKFIKSLQIKKYRHAEQSFVVQGGKAVTETLSSDYRVQFLAGTKAFLSQLPASLRQKADEVAEATADALVEIGSLDSNDAALAVVSMKSQSSTVWPAEGLVVVLDDIRDPGNLGTMIRTCDWFGIRHILASPETADLYNPKVINASMGSFLRVSVTYQPLPEALQSSRIPVIGTFLDGEDIHSFKVPEQAWLVIGNEARGISPEVGACVTHRVTIPRIGKAESLNASTALAVVLDQFSNS